MQLKTRIQHSFDKAASQYDLHALLQRNVAALCFKESVELFPESGKILDAGCGTGYFHELARSHKKRYNITQLDLAYGMCRIAQHYASPPEYGGTYTVNADMEALPFQDSCMDGVFSSLAMQWAGQPALALAEFHRILHPRGSLALTTLLPGTLRELEHVFSLIDDNPHINRFSPQSSLLSSAEEAGFTDITHHSECRTLFYPTAHHLLKSLKGIGASYKQGKGGFSRQKFSQMETLYQQHYGTTDGIPASWEVLYITARK